MKQKTTENVKVTTINEKYEQLVRLDTTKLKPFQVHFMEDVVLMKEFVESQKVLNEKNSKELSACDMLVDAILNKAITEIDVSVGERCKNHFNTYLHIHTDAPSITIGNWNKVEPVFCISDSNYRTNNILCSMNLILIKNLKVEIREGYECNIYQISFSCGEIDYDIQMRTTC